jgi:ubiquinone/menaquinone biosynthesis C-methylase UbiE
MAQNKDSWEKAHHWYDRIVGEKGHYYHEQVIIPNVLRLLNLTPATALLDIGCGQGILARHLPDQVHYMGIDIAPSLIRAAKKYCRATQQHRFLVADAAQSLPLQNQFSHAAIILTLQNIAQPLAVLKNIYPHLKSQGQLIIVLNHPYFRIPRQTHWEIDREKKIQYRRVDRYLSALKIPIQMHPGKKESSTTTSYHFPLSTYSQWLKEAGFVIEWIEEWCSDKTSTGGAAAMENRSRQEFPLFLALVCRKL